MRLLIINGHGSYVDKAFLNLFSPLATYYSQNLDNWLAKFQALFWPAFKKAFSLSNIKKELNNDALTLQQLQKEFFIQMSKSFQKEFNKFEAKLLKMSVKNEVLEHENKGLKEAIKLKQRRRKP
ncbi:hypothetical protein EV356DRAFT_506934 [Viridothelium virens]|uniref:Uncharacterized protein n=1 Tax=Viridothelium virens TaxID=1048519 RepID=A0A6A6GRH2_VIRVR|nr:hypothetical protein EV356DRAFT_506934 [Viridothelium virens]